MKATGEKRTVAGLAKNFEVVIGDKVYTATRLPSIVQQGLGPRGHIIRNVHVRGLDEKISRPATPEEENAVMPTLRERMRFIDGLVSQFEENILPRLNGFSQPPPKVRKGTPINKHAQILG
jgi:hypothetical protein